MTSYPYQESTHKQVQECCEREFAAKLGEFDYIATTVFYNFERAFDRKLMGKEREGVLSTIRMIFFPSFTYIPTV